MESNSWGLKKSFKVSYPVPINVPGKGYNNLFSSALGENLCGPHQLPWALARTTHPSKACVAPGGRLYFHRPHILKKKKKKERQCKIGVLDAGLPSHHAALWQRGPGPLRSCSHSFSMRSSAPPHPLHHCFHTSMVLPSILTFLTWLRLAKSRN